MTTTKAQLNAQIAGIRGDQSRTMGNLADLIVDLTAAWDDWYETKTRQENMTNLGSHLSVPGNGLVQMFKDSLSHKHSKLVSFSNDYDRLSKHLDKLAKDLVTASDKLAQFK